MLDFPRGSNDGPLQDEVKERKEHVALPREVYLEDREWQELLAL